MGRCAERICRRGFAQKQLGAQEDAPWKTDTSDDETNDAMGAGSADEISRNAEDPTCHAQGAGRRRANDEHGENALGARTFQEILLIQLSVMPHAVDRGSLDDTRIVRERVSVSCEGGGETEEEALA